MLQTITNRKKEELTSLQLPAERLTEAPKLSLADALRNSSYPLGIIAEVKKASPSKGVLLEDFHPVAIAKEYESVNASGISVLTDRDFFQGHAQYLTDIKNEVNLPLLRKDFLIDHRQVTEAERIGADAILLIAAILEGKQLQELYLQAEELGMEVLVEVHNEEELEKVLTWSKPEIIGVNNRNLNTFETDLATSARLQPLIPEDILFISESGVHNSRDAQYLASIGADGLLIGEGFMKAVNKKEFIHSLFSDLS
ncbi:indole-3-glycerol phosphate synthase TrpC [Alkalicoccus daliensis]|uniref:indole-3-glycerol phosphate synthase TrpC n=1 Tax=Alkalicoccus daliensis TaxID=745820 RepID=UPI003CC79DA0